MFLKPFYIFDDQKVLQTYSTAKSGLRPLTEKKLAEPLWAPNALN